ncbi:MAG: murein L,D-transpeptidase catalytic domain family protein [Prolixibacteraceae bacterium]|nr:murein L,D-transpeptidase catalytic domain family protein [Prolixibacteraceae bacterium]
MRKFIFYLIFLLIPLVNDARVVGLNTINSAGVINLELYKAVNLSELGLDKTIFELAIKGLNKLVSSGKLLNSTIVTIVDFSQSCNKKRLYVIDLKNKRMLFNTYVAHGRNTGTEFAKSFSNEEGSLKSSLGFYITAHPITGSHTGFSLMIDGVEKGINDHACKRAIIIHGADYVTENFIRKNGRLGRSLGCPALPPDLNKPIIETIKDGTCLFIYNPDNHYLGNSSLLN